MCKPHLVTTGLHVFNFKNCLPDGDASFAHSHVAQQDYLVVVHVLARVVIH
jgi:hypothetical protein